jgi:ribonuclease P protein component
MRYTFPKSEKLKSKLAIQQLFVDGKSFGAYPLVLRYSLRPMSNESVHYQAAFVVPKKKIKQATHRNSEKRKIKEAYRLAKHKLAIPQGKCLHLLFIYLSAESSPYAQIEKSVEKIIAHVNNELLG